jgi:hypothetical protein
VSAEPRARYAERLAAREATVARLLRRDDLLARTRLVAVVVALLVGWRAAAGALSGWWLALPLGAFVALVVLHARNRAARELAARSVAFYVSGLARMDERWAGLGVPGDGFHDPHHPYAEDLDLFGRGSLFELLCTCRTRPGEATLAAWLLAPATRAELRARQAAAGELGAALDLREDLARLGDDMRSEVDAARIVAWATAAGVLRSRALRVVAAVLGLAAAAGIGFWLAGAGLGVLLVVLVLELPVHALVHRASLRVAREVDVPARALALVGDLLERFGAETFASAALAGRARGAHGAVAAIRALRRLVDLLDAQRNPLFAPIALATLWPAQLAFAIEAWRARHGADVGAWLETLGEIEALVAVGTYAAEHPEDVLPDLVEGPARFDAEALGHPLLPRATCVRNDVRLGESCAVLVVSGSNMSGKSTLLRSVGVAAVLTQLGAPVRARRLALSTFRLGASIRTLDSLQEGTSRFYAEITRLRQLVELASGPAPLLFLLDEILHGTNSHDRRIGAEAVVRGLVARGAVGLVTTHDLALATIADTGALRARNVHFEDHVEGTQMVFDYRMRDGVVTHSNALALMRAVGLEV